MLKREKNWYLVAHDTHTVDKLGLGDSVGPAGDTCQ
jgi:hypothetical protein